MAGQNKPSIVFAHGLWADGSCFNVWTAPAVQGKTPTFRETIRVQPCIRPLDAAVVAAGPDVIR